MEGLAMQLRIILPLILILSINLISQNTQKTFTGAGGNNNWQNPDNWEPRGVPTSGNENTAGDNVLIPEGKTVDLGGSIGVAVNITNNGTITNALGVIAKNDITNEGVIVGVTDSKLGLFSDYITNHGTIGIPGEYGVLSIEARAAIINDGILEARRKVNIIGQQIENNADVYAKYDIKVYAGQRFFNKGKVYTIGNADKPAGNSIEITCVNTEGTSEFYNTGTIEGGDGEEGMRGDQIKFWADFWKNRGNIESGEPGEGDRIRGGNITVYANLIDNAGVVYGPKADLCFIGQSVKHNPNYDDSPSIINSKNKSRESIQSEYFRIESDYLSISAKEILCGNLGNFGSGTTIIGIDAVYISNTTEGGAFMDFSEDNFPGTIVSDHLIQFSSNNIIEPEGGLASLCSITPQINPAEGEVYSGVIISSDINDSPGAVNQGTAIFKNQCSFENSFPYSVTSQLGWVTDVSAETGILNPWEIFSIEFDYQIPEGITKITIDTFIVSVVMSQFATMVKKFALICDPDFVSSIEDSAPVISGFELKQNYPNPFNPVTKIQFALPQSETQHSVSLRVYDIIGREVAVLVNEAKEAGIYEVTFDASKLSSGLYFYSLSTSGKTITKKMMLLR